MEFNKNDSLTKEKKKKKKKKNYESSEIQGHEDSGEPSHQSVVDRVPVSDLKKKKKRKKTNDETAASDLQIEKKKKKKKKKKDKERNRDDGTEKNSSNGGGLPDVGPAASLQSECSYKVLNRLWNELNNPNNHDMIWAEDGSFIIKNADQFRFGGLDFIQFEKMLERFGFAKLQGSRTEPKWGKYFNWDFATGNLKNLNKKKEKKLPVEFFGYGNKQGRQQDAHYSFLLHEILVLAKANVENCSQAQDFLAKLNSDAHSLVAKVTEITQTYSIVTDP